MSTSARLDKYFHQGDLEGARRAVKKLLLENPSDVDALVGKARLLTLDGQHAQALDILNPLIEKNPDHAPARTYKAVVLELMGKAQTAEVLLRAATRVDPLFAPARYNLARHLVRAGKRDEALGELEHAARADPDNPTYHLRIAELQLELGDNTQAGEVLTALVSTFPGYSFGWLLAARAYMARGDARGALRLIAASIEHCPTDVPLAIAGFQAGAAVGDLPLCEQTIKIVGQFDEAFAHQLRKVLQLFKIKREEEIESATLNISLPQCEEVAYFVDVIAAASPNKKRQGLLREVAKRLRRRVKQSKPGPKRPPPR
ncbi:MAG: tetratricopeptide repeat protein [Pseudomonadota bacterium]